MPLPHRLCLLLLVFCLVQIVLYFKYISGYTLNMKYTLSILLEIVTSKVSNFFQLLPKYHESFHGKKRRWKSMELSMDLWDWNKMKATISFWTAKYVDCIAFLLLFLSILFTIEPNNFKKSYSLISEKHDQSSINLTNVFNFIG